MNSKNHVLRSVFFGGVSLFFCSVFGQNVQNIHIQASKSKTFNLSEIAEHVQPVGLEMNPKNQFDNISDVLWTNQYLFICVREEGDKRPSKVLQYDHSGKFIRQVGKQHAVSKLLCDTVKKMIFISKGNEFNCYDFEGRLKETYLLKNSNAIYDGRNFWVHYTESGQNGIHYFLTCYDVQTAKEDIVFDFVDRSGENSRFASFSFRGKTPIVSFGIDNTLHQIQGKKITPIVKFTIDPKPVVFLDKYGYQFQGFIGNFLCIHYMRNWQHYVYLQNMRTGIIYHTKYSPTHNDGITDGITDDMLSTGFCKISPLNRSGYFYFVKNRDQLNKNPNFSNEKTEFTIFFVKLKP